MQCEIRLQRCPKAKREEKPLYCHNANQANEAGAIVAVAANANQANEAGALVAVDANANANQANEAGALVAVAANAGGPIKCDFSIRP